MAKTGRKSTFKAKIGEKICERLSDGESLRSICRDEKMPGLGQVMRWLLMEGKKYDTFREQYRVAREAYADIEFERLNEIIDNEENDYIKKETKNGNIITVVNHVKVQRDNLRINTRKWALARMSPKKYGERQTIDQNHFGKIALNVTPDTADAVNDIINN